jgi:hypothetical protein
MTEGQWAAVDALTAVPGESRHATAAQQADIRDIASIHGPY